MNRILLQLCLWLACNSFCLSVRSKVLKITPKTMGKCQLVNQPPLPQVLTDLSRWIIIKEDVLWGIVGKHTDVVWVLRGQQMLFQSNISWRRLVRMTDSRCVMHRRSLWATPAHCSQWWSCAFTPPPVTFPCAMLDVSHMCTGVMLHSQASVWDLKHANGNHLHPILQPSAAWGGFSGRLILKRSQICESDVIYYLGRL